MSVDISDFQTVNDGDEISIRLSDGNWERFFVEWHDNRLYKANSTLEIFDGVHNPTEIINFINHTMIEEAEELSKQFATIL